MRAMDLDRNGEIDLMEFLRGLINLSIQLPKLEAVALFKCLDTNRNGSIEVEEICILLDV